MPARSVWPQAPAATVNFLHMGDLRLGLRNLIRRPAFAIVAVLTLALGIGANAAVFTVSSAVLLAPLPYDNPRDVVVLNERTRQFAALSVTRYNYDDWRQRAKSFTGIAAFRPTNMTLAGSGDPERIPIKMITATLLPLLGVTPLHGRGFGEADDRPGAESVAILSAAFADRRFSGDRARRPDAAARQPCLHHRGRAAARVRAVSARRRLRPLRSVGRDTARGPGVASRDLSYRPAEGRRFARAGAGRDGHDCPAARRASIPSRTRTYACSLPARRISSSRTSDRRCSC